MKFFDLCSLFRREIFCILVTWLSLVILECPQAPRFIGNFHVVAVCTLRELVVRPCTVFIFHLSNLYSMAYHRYVWVQTPGSLYSSFGGHEDHFASNIRPRRSSFTHHSSFQSLLEKFCNWISLGIEAFLFSVSRSSSITRFLGDNTPFCDEEVWSKTSSLDKEMLWVPSCCFLV